MIPPLGAYSYWADPYTLFVLEVVLLGFAEYRRAQDYYSKITSLHRHPNWTCWWRLTV